MDSLIIGTRGSPLSIIAAGIVSSRIKKAFPELSIIIKKIRTEGDNDRTTPIPDLNYKKGDGIFTTLIEKELLNGSIDIAVHSLKDLPTLLPRGLIIGAVLERDDPRDVLISRDKLKLKDLPNHATIGTDSPRRSAQLLAFRKDINVKSLRGNVQTRIQKLFRGDYDAIVLSAAGILRLGLSRKITQYLPLDIMLPAPGQGAVAVEIRDGDGEIMEITCSINHKPTELAVNCEREFLLNLGGGCRVPIGAHSNLKDGVLTLDGMISNNDGTQIFREVLKSNYSGYKKIGMRLAKLLLKKGAKKILKEHLALYNKKILITRASEQANELSDKLSALGASTILFPTIKFEPLAESQSLRLTNNLEKCDWLVFTSVNGVRFFFECLEKERYDIKILNFKKIAAVGPSTAASLNKKGIKVDFFPKRHLTSEIAGGMGGIVGKRILLPRTDIACRDLAKQLTNKGALVDEVVVYRTLSVDDSRAIELNWLLEERKLDLIIFTSASTVQNFARLLSRINVRYSKDFKTKVACIGPVTAKAAEMAGIKPDIVAKIYTIDGLLAEILQDLQEF